MYTTTHVLLILSPNDNMYHLWSDGASYFKFYFVVLALSDFTHYKIHDLILYRRNYTHKYALPLRKWTKRHEIHTYIYLYK